MRKIPFLHPNGPLLTSAGPGVARWFAEEVAASGGRWAKRAVTLAGAWRRVRRSWAAKFLQFARLLQIYITQVVQ